MTMMTIDIKPPFHETKILCGQFQSQNNSAAFLRLPDPTGFFFWEKNLAKIFFFLFGNIIKKIRELRKWHQRNCRSPVGNFKPPSNMALTVFVQLVFLFPDRIQVLLLCPIMQSFFKGWYFLQLFLKKTFDAISPLCALMNLCYIQASMPVSSTWWPFNSKSRFWLRATEGTGKNFQDSVSLRGENRVSKRCKMKSSPVIRSDQKI